MLTATYIVLALPVAIFMGAWFSPWIAVPAGLALCVAGLQTRARPPATHPSRFTYAAILVALGVSVFWLCMSGAGGVGWQQGD